MTKPARTPCGLTGSASEPITPACAARRSRICRTAFVAEAAASTRPALLTFLNTGPDLIVAASSQLLRARTGQVASCRPKAIMTSAPSPSLSVLDFSNSSLTSSSDQVRRSTSNATSSDRRSAPAKLGFQHIGDTRALKRGGGGGVAVRDQCVLWSWRHLSKAVLHEDGGWAPCTLGFQRHSQGFVHGVHHRVETPGRLPSQGTLQPLAKLPTEICPEIMHIAPPPNVATGTTPRPAGFDYRFRRVRSARAGAPFHRRLSMRRYRCRNRQAQNQELRRLRERRRPYRWPPHRLPSYPVTQPQDAKPRANLSDSRPRPSLNRSTALPRPMAYF